MISEENQQRYLRSGLALYPSQYEEIEETLLGLKRQISASFILLTDVTGQVIFTDGESGKKNVVALGSLVAGDLAASHEIARLTEQYEDHQLVLREGKATHTFICQAGHHLALLAQVPSETPLGWARVAINKITQKLKEISESEAVEAESLAVDETAVKEEMGFNDEGLSNLFDDALDDLWME